MIHLEGVVHETLPVVDAAYGITRVISQGFRGEDNVKMYSVQLRIGLFVDKTKANCLNPNIQCPEVVQDPDDAEPIGPQSFNCVVSDSDNNEDGYYNHLNSLQFFEGGVEV